MSGHSKWHQIHRQKSISDTKRGALFTKLGKTISVAAKIGGADPATNFRLRLAIEKARAANMTKENIERAVKRGAGTDATEQIEAITYEGFGPGGAAIIIECLTDNRNRTASAIKHLLSEHGGSFGSPNSVSWMFDQKGVIRVDQAIDEDFQLELIDQGAEDFSHEEKETYVYCKIHDLKKLSDYLENKKYKVAEAEIEWLPKEKKMVGPEEKEKLEMLFAQLEESEDVNEYYTNAEF